MEALIDKWDRIYSQSGHEACSPARALIDNAFLLPEAGVALDLACGLGANAIFLAQQGLAVTALDISFVAIEKLTARAALQGLNINAHQKKIDCHSLAELKFDVIVVSRFLDRALSDAIIDALNPAGLLFYQTYTREKAGRHGPNNPGYLLAENELLELFSPLRVVFYRDNGLIGNKNLGLRGEAQFVGQKHIET